MKFGEGCLADRAVEAGLVGGKAAGGGMRFKGCRVNAKAAEADDFFERDRPRCNRANDEQGGDGLHDRVCMLDHAEDGKVTSANQCY